MDPILSMMSRLEQALKQAETGSLAPDSWASLLSDEDALERRLLELVEKHTASGQFENAAQLWTTIAEFNDRAASIIDLIIQHSSTDSRDVDQLAGDRQICTNLSTFAQAQASLCNAISQRLSNDPAASEASAKEAIRLFKAVAESGWQVASVLATAAEGVRLGAVGTAQQFHLQYRDAALTYLQASKIADQARGLALESGDVNEAMLAGFAADSNAYKTAAGQALLLAAVSDGEFEEAVTHAAALVEYNSAQDNSDLAPIIRRSIELTRFNAAAYLSYAEAEVAANSQNWDEVQRKLAEAEDQWRQVVTKAMELGIPQSGTISGSAQAVSSQIAGSFRQHIKREQSLYAQIAELQAENQQLQDEIFQLASKPTFSGGYIGGDRYIVGQAGSVGRNASVSGTRWAQANAADVLSNIDMPVLAEELEVLTGVLEQSASDPDQYVALAELSRATQAAKEGDIAGTLHRLKYAGTWALKNAIQVGIPLASSAIKASIGLEPSLSPEGNAEQQRKRFLECRSPENVCASSEFLIIVRITEVRKTQSARPFLIPAIPEDAGCTAAGYSRYAAGLPDHQ